MALAAAPTVLAVTLLAPRPGLPAVRPPGAPRQRPGTRPPSPRQRRRRAGAASALPARAARRVARDAAAGAAGRRPIEVPGEAPPESAGRACHAGRSRSASARATGRGAGRRRRLGAGPATRAVRPRDRGQASPPITRPPGPPFVSLKEATTLRTHDYFPRLPAALWPERGPYVVAIELCVSEHGQVSEAELLSGASARLDPVVLAAVRGWRYRPRLESGKPSPFCHGVIIKYERHY